MPTEDDFDQRFDELESRANLADDDPEFLSHAQFELEVAALNKEAEDLGVPWVGEVADQEEDEDEEPDSDSDGEWVTEATRYEMTILGRKLLYTVDEESDSNIYVDGAPLDSYSDDFVIELAVALKLDIHAIHKEYDVQAAGWLRNGRAIQWSFAAMLYGYIDDELKDLANS